MSYKVFEDESKRLNQKYGNRGQICFYTPPRLLFTSQFNGSEAQYTVREGGKEILSLDRDGTSVYISMASTYEREADIFLELPKNIMIGAKLFENKISEGSWLRRRRIRRDLQALFNGEEFPFDSYPAEEETLRCLVFGYRKIGEFNSYIEKLFPEFANMASDLAKSKPLSPKKTMEIIDKPIAEEDLIVRMAEAAREQRFEEAAYYRDRLSELKAKRTESSQS